MPHLGRDAASTVYKPCPQTSPPSSFLTTALGVDGTGWMDSAVSLLSWDPSALGRWRPHFIHGVQSPALCSRARSLDSRAAELLSTQPENWPQCSATLASNSSDCWPFVMTGESLSFLRLPTSLPCLSKALCSCKTDLLQTPHPTGLPRPPCSYWTSA